MNFRALFHRPHAIRIFFGVVMTVVLVITSLNLIRVLFLYQLGNDQCLWTDKPDGSGYVISQIMPGGVADKAGLRDGDLLVKINGVLVGNTMNGMKIISSLKEGEQALYLVEREGRSFETRVTILKVFDWPAFAQYFLGLGFLLVSLIVVFTKPLEKVPRLFAWYGILSMMYFGLTIVRYGPGTSQFLAIVTEWGFWIARVFGPPFFLWFFLEFPVHIPLKRPRLLASLLLASSLAVSLVIYFREALHFPMWVGEYLYYGFYLYYLCGLAVFVYSFFFRVEKARRRELRPILDAVGVGALSIIYMMVVAGVNRMALFFTPMLLVPSLLMTMIPLAFGYSIFRYKLMDIDLIIRRSLIYAIVMALIAALYLTIVLGIGNLLRILFNFRDNDWLHIVALLSVAFALNPLRERVQELVGRVFYQERYGYQLALRGFSKELPRLMNLDQILRSVVTRISSTMHVEKVGVKLVGNRGNGECAGIAGNEPGCTLSDADDGLLALILRVRTPVTFRADDLEYTSLAEQDRTFITANNIQLAVPMFVQNTLSGVIFVGPKKSGRFFSQDDIDLLETVGSQAAIAVENSILHEQEIEKEKMEKELSLARKIQQGLLPKSFPELPGLSMTGVSVPASTIGGDYFDFIQLDEHRVLAVIADVSGKGMPAALYMSKVQGMLHMAADVHDSLTDILVHINKRIFRGLERNTFITMLAALFDIERHTVTICRAGHPQPIVTGSDGAYYLVSRGVGLGLNGGVIFDRELEEVTLDLRPGQTFVLYSDGITEAMNPAEAQYGEPRLLDLVNTIAGTTVDMVQSAILASVQDFSSGEEQHDDQTLVVVKVERP